MWTLQRLSDYMAEQTGMRASYETVRLVLKAALLFVLANLAFALVLAAVELCQIPRSVRADGNMGGSLQARHRHFGTIAIGQRQPGRPIQPGSEQGHRCSGCRLGGAGDHKAWQDHPPNKAHELCNATKDLHVAQFTHFCE